MKKSSTSEEEWEKIVQREEAVKGRVINRETSPKKLDNRSTNTRQGREKVSDNSCTPEASLSPRKNITSETSSSSQNEKNKT